MRATYRKMLRELSMPVTMEEVRAAIDPDEPNYGEAARLEARCITGPRPTCWQ